jgi:hypothetical protein
VHIGSFRLKYSAQTKVRMQRLLVYSAPPRLQVSLEIGPEGEEAAWARIPELDITAEGDDMSKALQGVVDAARNWLAYLREQEPELAPELVGQKRYVGLLDVPPYGWFRSYRLVL